VQYYSKTYKATSGTSSNTTLQLNNTFVGSIGDAGGYVTIPVNAPSNGNYYLDIKYLAGDKDRPLKIAINGIPTGITYTTKQTTGWTQNDIGVLRITVALNLGINIIKLYNDNNLAGPWVGNLRLTLIFTPINNSTLPQGTYNTALGILYGGAAINSVNYTGWLGGPTDGSSTVTVNVTTASSYNIAVKYIGPDTSRPLKVDVNGVNTGTIYSLPPTAGWTINDALVFTIPVTLNVGNNTIKFHGDGANYSQNLGIFTVSLQGPSPLLSYNMNKAFNGSTDYLDITRELSKVQNLTAGAIVVKFKSTSTTPGLAILTMSDSTNASTYLSVMLSTGTAGRLRYEIKQNGTQTFGYNTAISVNDGNVHTALISVGSRGIEGYVDGVNVYTVPTSNNFFSNITGENIMNIGKLVTSSGSSWHFNGTIEYVDIYSGELSVAEAK
ncbi:MAG: sialidase domain-containing protein, partial [Sarcina sp.]